MLYFPVYSEINEIWIKNRQYYSESTSPEGCSLVSKNLKPKLYTYLCDWMKMIYL